MKCRKIITKIYKKTIDKFYKKIYNVSGVKYVNRNRGRYKMGDKECQIIETAQLSGYCERYIKYIDRKDTTMAAYIAYLRQFVLWLGSEGINTPCRDDIINYRDYLKDKGLSVGTQQQYLRAVKQFYGWLSVEGLASDITTNIHSPKVGREHKKDAFEAEDIKIIADSIDRNTKRGKYLYALLLLCVVCGLRTVEVSRANVGDIRTHRGKYYLSVQGKGKDDKDTDVLLPEGVMQAINDYLHTRTNIKGNSPLFAASSNYNAGDRIAAGTLGKTIKTLLRKAGYDSARLTAHSLRHTSGTLAYNITKDLYTAQQHQRHSNPATTEIYIHATERERRTTEEQIYNHIFGDESTEQKNTLINMVATLNEEEIQKVIAYIRDIRRRC